MELAPHWLSRASSFSISGGKSLAIVTRVPVFRSKPRTTWSNTSALRFLRSRESQRKSLIFRLRKVFLASKR